MSSRYGWVVTNQVCDIDAVHGWLIHVQETLWSLVHPWLVLVCIRVLVTFRLWSCPLALPLGLPCLRGLPLWVWLGFFGSLPPWFPFFAVLVGFSLGCLHQSGVVWAPWPRPRSRLFPLGLCPRCLPKACFRWCFLPWRHDFYHGIGEVARDTWCKVGAIMVEMSLWRRNDQGINLGAVLKNTKE